jgi:DNA-binding NarL/FixJ family response regulator
MCARGAVSRAKTGSAIRVVLADRTRMDCQLLAESLEESSSRCKVAGTAVSVEAAGALIKQQRPHVAVISPHLAEGPLVGFDLVQETREMSPAVRAIVLLDSMEPRMVIYSFQVGARGVFSRDRSVQALAKCIEVVDGGQIWAGTNELEIILQAMARRSRFEPTSAVGAKLLTSREGEVARLVAEGLRNREISERLHLSTHTVKNYLYRVYEKLGISSRVELTAHVLERTIPAEIDEEPLEDQNKLAG